jgi:hypothetical protein
MAPAVLALMLGGCSTVMEANRPDPVDLQKYSVGEKRMDVIARLGAPESSVKDGDKSCDIYKLYTRGVTKVDKGAIILGEAAADVFTLGLAEAVTTTGEAVTKNKKHTVLICYSVEDLLVSILDEGKSVPAAPVAPATQPPAQPAT